MRKTSVKRHSSSNLVRRQGLRDIKQSFLVVCEGECTEPDYFKAFRLTTATVRTVGQAMNAISLVHKAISIRDTDKLKRKVYDQCWVVFDKDDFPARDFNMAIKLAESNGFRVAYSKKEGFASDLYNILLSRQPQAIKNAEVVLTEISVGNPAAEESSTTVHQLVTELNKYL